MLQSDARRTKLKIPRPRPCCIQTTKHLHKLITPAYIDCSVRDDGLHDLQRLAKAFTACGRCPEDRSRCTTPGGHFLTRTARECRWLSRVRAAPTRHPVAP